MFDKIVKKVFLTKEARDALEARKNAGSKPPAAKPAELQDKLAMDAAEAELRHSANATELERETIREAIATAHQELVVEGDIPPSPTVSRNGSTKNEPAEDHDQLVKSAMLIYRQKQKVLADLDPGSRKKLRLMAKTIFGAQMKK